MNCKSVASCKVEADNAKVTSDRSVSPFITWQGTCNSLYYIAHTSNLVICIRPEQNLPIMLFGTAMILAQFYAHIKVIINDYYTATLYMILHSPQGNPFPILFQKQPKKAAEGCTSSAFLAASAQCGRIV